ncbi:2-oxo acid dehydrogenase subunit E2, partial [Salmonella enterica subsp. enterica serovar Montevideo]|nr:2-oxo acid dehydrogenase subunit E2 [Salmonella enterica subsp. enterica serovar Montevideo]
AMAVDHEIGMVSLVRNLEEFFARESCGWCTPCRDGLPWSVKIPRVQYGEVFEKRHGIRLGFMSFYVKAVVEALKRYPEVNASIDGDD